MEISLLIYPYALEKIPFAIVIKDVFKNQILIFRHSAFIWSHMTCRVREKLVDRPFVRSDKALPIKMQINVKLGHRCATIILNLWLSPYYTYFPIFRSA